MSHIPFRMIDWETVLKTIHPGEKNSAYWQTLQFEGLRIRIVEYEAGYLADHSCEKGHIVHCLEGESITNLSHGEKFTLTKGMTHIVSDQQSSHRSESLQGVRLLIIDGDFLRSTDPSIT